MEIEILNASANLESEDLIIYLDLRAILNIYAFNRFEYILNIHLNSLSNIEISETNFISLLPFRLFPT